MFRLQGYNLIIMFTLVVLIYANSILVLWVICVGRIMSHNFEMVYLAISYLCNIIYLGYAS